MMTTTTDALDIAVRQRIVHLTGIPASAWTREDVALVTAAFTAKASGSSPSAVTKTTPATVTSASLQAQAQMVDALKDLGWHL